MPVNLITVTLIIKTMLIIKGFILYVTIFMVIITLLSADHLFTDTASWLLMLVCSISLIIACRELITFRELCKLSGYKLFYKLKK